MASRIPQHRRLYEILRKHITEGVYKDGDLLPSENELCCLHSLTRPTVRQALSSLMNDGYIKKQQGKGSIVCLQPKSVGILSIKGITAALGNDTLETRILQKSEVKLWPDNFIFPLSELEQKSGCVHFERIRLINNKPIFYDISYIPNINIPRFTSRSLKNNSLFEILRKYYQIDIKGGKQRIRAVKADEKICKFLNLDKDHPVLHLERKIDTNRVNFSIYSILYCDTENHTLYGEF